MPIPNANSTSLTLSNLTVAGTTAYVLVSSNLLGAITSTITEVVLADPPVNIPSGLLSYWPLDTTNAVPSTPDLINHDDLILLPAGGSLPYLVPGDYSNALSFAAGDIQAAACFDGIPNYDLTNYSVSLWVQGQPQAQLRVFSESSSQNSSPLFTIGTETTGFLPYASILVRNDQGTALVNNLSSSGTAFDGNWHNIVWTDNNGTALLYIDGVLDPVSFSYVRSGTFTLDTTSIGGIVRSATPDHSFTGNIDEVGVWNRRLSYSEIQALLTNTIPVPAILTLTPPSVFRTAINPPDPTNFLFVGDQFSIEVLAGGTQPLSFQWLKNGLPIDPGVNPTATNNTFSISSVATSDSGAYSLVISNGDPVLLGGGVITSAVVTATVQIPTTNGQALLLDVNLAGSPDTQPGFEMYTTSLAGDTFANAIQVTISAVGTTLAARDRNPPTTAAYVANGPGLTQALLYNSFIFADSTTPGTGLQILLSNLVPNTPYKVILWSFDPVSGGNRVSDWTELSSGTPIVVETNYVFNGSVLPTLDYQDTITATLTSSPTGTLIIQGLTDANNTSFGAFINAIKLVANPGPSVTITGVAVAADANLRITTSGQYAGQPVEFSSSPGITPASWQPVVNSITITNIGTTCITEIPITPGVTPQLFFRAQGF